MTILDSNKIISKIRNLEEIIKAVKTQRPELSEEEILEILIKVMG